MRCRATKGASWKGQPERMGRTWACQRWPGQRWLCDKGHLEEVGCPVCWDNRGRGHGAGHLVGLALWHPVPVV